jgi:sugar lactone lactonase YvrE
VASWAVGSVGNAPGQLNHPRQLAVNAEGQIFTAEEFNYRLSVLNADGTFDKSVGQQGSGVGSALFERPNGIAVGLSGNIYVADTWNYRVVVLSPTGDYITSWGQKGELGANAPVDPKDAFWGPRAVAVDSQERVYVADTGNKRVRVYSKEGQYLRDIGSGGSGNGQLDEPAGLAIGANGLLYIADTWNRRISVFTLDGVPVGTYQQPDGSFTNFFKIRGWYDDLGNRPYVAVDNQRSVLYVTDPDAGRVLVYNATNGQCLGAFGQLNRERQDASQFASIGGIATDGQGDVYVADAGSGRIMRFARYDWPGLVNPQSAPGQVNQQPAQIQPEKTADVPNLEITVEIGPASTGEVTPQVGG